MKGFLFSQAGELLHPVALRGEKGTRQMSYRYLTNFSSSFFPFSFFLFC